MSMSPPALPPFWTIWWRSIDRWSLVSVLILMGLGVWLIMESTPAIALQHNWTPFLLLKRHFMIVGPSLVLLVATSCLQRNSILKIALATGLLAWLGIWAVSIWGVEIKGARRWLSIGSFSLQPSEFLKPALSIAVAYVLSYPLHFLFSGALIALAIMPLFLQPDLGMIVVMCIVWFGQCFVGGLPWIWTIGAMTSAVFAGAGVYLCFPHAAYRIQTFLSGADQDPLGSQYQVTQALKSFSSGGWLGKGPGAGSILNVLPDAHADFIFAVAGEEMGLLFCIGIVILYAILLWRFFLHAFQEIDQFHALAIVGLGMQIILQALLNMASVLRMIPTKGVTLPFISYGGSSLLSLCWAMGLLLALTRRYRRLI
jgi:cell division protein FtsW